MRTIVFILMRVGPFSTFGVCRKNIVKESCLLADFLWKNRFCYGRQGSGHLLQALKVTDVFELKQVPPQAFCLDKMIEIWE